MSATDWKNKGGKQGHEIQGPVREGCSFKEGDQGRPHHWDNDFGGRVWRGEGRSQTQLRAGPGWEEGEGSHRELRAAFLRAAQGAGPEARERLSVERKSVRNRSEWPRLRAPLRGKY